MKNTSIFKSKHSNEVYQIKKNFNCNSKMLVYLIECAKQYNGSSVTKFGARANNYKSTHRNFLKEQILPNQARTRITRNVFTNIICGMTITGFVTGRSQ